MNMPETSGVVVILYRRAPQIVRDWIASRHGAFRSRCA
jgi:hypothetical protein